MADRPISPLRTINVWQWYRFEAEADHQAVAMVDHQEGFDTHYLRVHGGSLQAFRLAGAVLELALAMKAAEDEAAERELYHSEVLERARNVEVPLWGNLLEYARAMVEHDEPGSPAYTKMCTLAADKLGLTMGTRLVTLLREEEKDRLIGEAAQIAADAVRGRIDKGFAMTAVPEADGEPF